MAGWVFGMLIVPVPSLIRRVAAAIHAMNATHEVMFSASVGDVFADIGFAEAQFFGEQESFAVLLQR